MNKQELQVLAQRAAKSVKSEKDLCDISAMLKKITVEVVLNAELDEYLGYQRHQPSDNTNIRNEYCIKILLIENGKHQTRLTAMDDKIPSLCAKGMITGEIDAIFNEMFDVNVSLTLVSKDINAVNERAIEWQSRSLNP